MQCANWLNNPRIFVVAGGGFEPPDLRVMSPTSYQTALPRVIDACQTSCKQGLLYRKEFSLSSTFQKFVNLFPPQGNRR